ncbi:MAG: transglutaminase domain-containing protein [Aristaeellaceae bacterium]
MADWDSWNSSGNASGSSSDPWGGSSFSGQSGSSFSGSGDSPFSGQGGSSFSGSGNSPFSGQGGSSFSGGGDDWSSPSSFQGDSASSSFGSFSSGNGQPPRKPGRSRVSRIAMGCSAAVIILAVVIVLVLAARPAVNTLPGRITYSSTSQEDGTIILHMRYEVTGLDDRLFYMAGFALAPEGEGLQAATDPVYVNRKQSAVVESDVVLSRPGRYQAAFYLIDPLQSLPQITAMQTLDITWDGQATTPPSTQDPWLVVITPTPSPSPTPTPSPSPSPSPSPTPSPTPSLKPEVVVTPTPSPTPLPTAPTSDLWSLYDADTRYYYFQLTTREKQLYSIIYDGVAAFDDNIAFPEPFTRDEYDRVVDVLIFDTPELFMQGNQNGGPTSYYSYNSQGITAHLPGYAMDKAQYELELKSTMQTIRSMQQLPGFGSSDYSRELTIYRYIIDHCYYDKELPFCSAANSVWYYHYAKCSGYARSLNLALRYYGIPCCEIYGDTYDNGVISPTGHLWSAVLLDGEWYETDVTWDDPSGLVIDVLDGWVDYLPYMNIDHTKMFSARSYRSDFTLTPPYATGYKYMYYNQEGCSVAAGSDVTSAIHAAITQAYQRGEDVAAISFDSARDYSTAMMSFQNICNNWRSGGKRLKSYRYYYTPETNVIYLFDLTYR